jgi:hypothetical protein
VVAAVLKQPVGIDDANREVLPGNLWRRWAADYVAKHSENDAADASAFGTRMCTGEFVLSVSREFVQSCPVPLLVMPGGNLDHPRSIGMEIAKLAPNAELIEEWREPSDLLPPAVARIRQFFRKHTPAAIDVVG